MINLSAVVNLYSDKSGEIQRFINKYLNEENNLCNELKWEKVYENPVDISDIIGIFIENIDKYNINMWVSCDKNAKKCNQCADACQTHSTKKMTKTTVE